MNVLRRFLGFQGMAADTLDQPGPKFPPEVWLNVFDHATHIPGAYTCDDGPAILAYAADQHGIALHSRHREATNTMLSASLVCKAWTPLADEFLFRYILVKSGNHAIKIATTLKHFADIRRRSSFPGRYALRLELFLEGGHHWDSSHTIALAIIFSLCPNICVFSTAFMPVDAPFYCALFMTAMQVVGMRSSLRRLELKGHAALFGGVLPPLAPHLESLVLVPLYAMGYKSELTFPNLRTFALLDRWAIPIDDDDPNNYPVRTVTGPPFQMPVLRALHLPPNYPPDSDFFPTVAGQLEYLSAGGNVSSVLKLCDSLTEWTLPAVLFVLIDRATFPSTLRVVNLDGGLAAFPLDRLAVWVTNRRGSALTTIRFLLPSGRRSGEITQDVRRVAELFVRACIKCGVDIELAKGVDQHVSRSYVPGTVELLAAALVAY
ncbi:hypothetical protein LXA43DRAFT_1034082 [Ganoderma leucocontextum]|nr:hypothetical protein LXA43DRAFT_1034082 [Ganoderma leucocontextum]